MCFPFVHKQNPSLVMSKVQRLNMAGSLHVHLWEYTYGWLVTVSVHSLHIEFNCFHFAS